MVAEEVRFRPARRMNARSRLRDRNMTLVSFSLSLFVFEYVLFYSVHPKLPSLGRAGIQLQAAAATSVARKEAIKHTTMGEEDNWS